MAPSKKKKLKKDLGPIDASPKSKEAIRSKEAAKNSERAKKSREKTKEHISKRIALSGPKERKDYEVDVTSNVAEGIDVEGPNQKSLFRLTYLNGRFDQLKKDFKNLSKIEKLGTKEKKEFVLGMKRQMEELKFLLKYIREEKNIEVRDDEHDIYEEDGEKFDLTETDEWIAEIESKLNEVKVDEKFLYKNLEKTRRSIRPKNFFKLPLEERLKLISNIHSWDQLKADTLVVFNFGGNRALFYQVGLGDVMPPSIREIKVGGSTYKRRGMQGFYRNGRYLPIRTGSRVTVGKIDKNYSPEKEFKQKFSADYVENEEKIGHGELTKKNIVEIAKDFMVDPYFLESVVKVIKEDSDNDVSDPEEFLHMAARYIQNAESKFENKHGSALEGGHYSVEFVVYTLDRLTLLNSYKSVSEKNVVDVLSTYDKFPGVSLSYRKVEAAKKAVRYDKDKAVERIRGQRDSNRPPSRDEAGEEYQGEIRYETKDVVRAPKEMKERFQKRLDKLEQELRKKGLSEYQIKVNVAMADRIYRRMMVKLGNMYNSKVRINTVDGKSWSIKNSCVGFCMDVASSNYLGVLRGKQTRKQAGRFYWGAKEPYIGSLVGEDSHTKKIRVQPGNVDALVGAHLEYGEPAVAALWNHVFWIYKDYDGTIMMVHSGADVRPKKINVPVGGEVPHGYRRAGPGSAVCRRMSGSKVNELPLAYFLAKKRKSYGGGWKSRLKFASLSTMVEDNLKSSIHGKGFRKYTEKIIGESDLVV